MNVLQIGSDRSKRGILNPTGSATARQIEYGKRLGHLDIIGFSLKSDAWNEYHPTPELSVYPTNSSTRFLYGLDAIFLLDKMPRPDMVSAQDPFEAGLIALIIARIKRVPLHVQVHTDIFSVAYARFSLLNRIRTIIAGFVLPRAARIRVVSSRLESMISLHAPQAPVTVLPIFANIEKIRATFPDETLKQKFTRFSTKLLVVARLEAEKNVELALRAFAWSASENACLIILGEGSERARLETIASELHVSERVFFEGEKDPAPYYHLADLILVTSRYEGYGLVIVEALAAGKPVLSTNVGVALEAGAIVVATEGYRDALEAWIKNGAREGVLKNYPYANFDQYADAYCADIEACVPIRAEDVKNKEAAM